MSGAAGDRGAPAPKPALAPSCSIRGRVALEGETPPGRAIPVPEGWRFEGVPSKMPDESVLAGADGSLRKAFAWIRKGFEGKPFREPESAARIEVSRIRSEPRALGLRIDERLAFRNADPVAQALHGNRADGAFNFTLPRRIRKCSAA